MTNKEMEKFIAHLDTYFQQTDCMVLHPLVGEPHIDTLIYKPNNTYPYWKLVTMGASDDRMPSSNPSLGNRNEYMMFIDASEDLENEDIRSQYVNYLMEVALYPIMHGCFISYGHSVEWAPDENEEMVGAYIEMPQIIEDTGVLRCKLGLLKTAVCLQVVLLTRSEIDKLLDVGPEEFSNYLYPENDAPCHFICELHRSEKF